MEKITINDLNPIPCNIHTAEVSYDYKGIKIDKIAISTHTKMSDIKKARNKDDSVKKEKKVISPYTMEPKKKNKIIPRIIWCLIIILVIIGGYFTYKTIADNNRAESNVLG